MWHEFIQINYMTIVSCLFLAIFTLTNRSFESELIKWFWLSIPLAANAICVFSAHISPLAFYYNDSNVFVRGPLGGLSLSRQRLLSHSHRDLYRAEI